MSGDESSAAGRDARLARHERVMSIFLKVCDLEAEERGAALDEACGGDPLLRTQVESMLRHDSGDDLFGVTTGFGEVGAAELLQQPLPESIGRYRVLRLIGAGGMGTVYEAEQESPKRRVALKVLHTHMGEAARMQARFVREGQIQSGLAHVGIAQVYETGVAMDHDRRVHFIAMELVEGPALTDFVRGRGMRVEATIGLFLRVCDAVGFAHQRGVIHRDLKPANIVVVDAGDGGGEAQPKVLDFGIAKRATREVSVASMQTQAGQIIGTLAYMSPEQVSGGAGEVDTRADVYALGFILFELLAGRLPLDVSDVPITEAIRRIAEKQPVHLATLDQRFRGDLGTIVHKAIAKEKSQRYDTVSEFAADLRRYLRNEPIAARPPSTMYQLRKFAQRHRALAAAAAVVVVTLVVGVIATTMLAISADRARKVAERKTLVAEGVSSVLLNALTTATPKGTVGKEPLLIDAVNRIESQVSSDVPASAAGAGADMPEVQAVVYNILGIIHRERGDLARAETVFTKALEIRERVLQPGDPNLADSVNNMGLLRRRQDRPAEAAVFYERAVALQRASTLRDDARLARNLYNLASAYIAAGDVERARGPLEESLAMHSALPGVSAEVINFHISARARIAIAEKRFEEAKALAEEALAKQREAVGAVHPSIALCLLDLAQAEMGLGETAKAVKLLREAEAMAESIFFNPSHHITRAIRVELAKALRAEGREDEALAVERKSVVPR